MRISSSSSLVILALSLSTANGAVPLQRQLIHALKSIQQSKMTLSLTVQKSVIRSLETEEDMCIEAFWGSGMSDGTEGDDGAPPSGENDFYCSNNSTYAQSMGGILCPATDSGVPMCPDGSDAKCCDVDQSCTNDTDEWCCGGDLDGEDAGYYDYDYVDGGYYDDDVTPLDFINALIDKYSKYCDSSTDILICDLLDETEAARIECDATGEKIISNDILMCKEDVPDDDEADGMDTIIRNMPFCVPQVCPDDTNYLKLFFPTFYSTSTGIEGDTETVPDIGIPNRKEECASGTTLLSASVENVSGSGDNVGGMDSGNGTSSVENISGNGDNGDGMDSGNGTSSVENVIGSGDNGGGMDSGSGNSSAENASDSVDNGGGMESDDGIESVSDSVDNGGGMDSDSTTSSAAVRSMIWSSAFAATAGIGAFFV